MKRVVVLGSTGSIGTQTLDVIAQHPDRLQVVGLAARRNQDVLEEQARAHGVRRTAIYEIDGMDAVVDLATMPEADIVVVSVAGVIGLAPTIAAIEAGKHIALASKEVLVAAGELVMPLVERHRVRLTPIDSEHSAIFQCLAGTATGTATGSAGFSRHDGTDGTDGGDGTESDSRDSKLEIGNSKVRNPTSKIQGLILTASGGPFRGRSRKELEGVTVEQALNHPTWRMGGKITIDSATLMNKGLETIEAKWLFGVDIDQVDTVIHPQSIIHSMVELADGSVLAQLGWPDMRLPIQVALLHPERVPNRLKPWNPLDSPTLTFEPVDHETFPSIRIAKESAEAGGTMPAAMNAANEEAANAFLRGEIPFLDIPEIVQKAMSALKSQESTLDNIIAADAHSREIARSLMKA